MWTFLATDVMGFGGLFIAYAVVSYVYRWVVTFGILWFFYQFLKPYKMGTVGSPGRKK